MDVGNDLRTGTGRWLRARRRIATIAGALAAEFAVIGMRQYGALRRLPDPPGFDSNAIVTAPQAYPFGVPDAALAVTGLGGIITLATARGSQRSRLWDLVLGAAVAIGAAGATYYLDVMRRERKVCAYCLAGAAGFYAMAALMAPWAAEWARSASRARSRRVPAR